MLSFRLAHVLYFTVRLFGAGGTGPVRPLHVGNGEPFGSSCFLLTAIRRSGFLSACQIFRVSLIRVFHSSRPVQIGQIHFTDLLKTFHIISFHLSGYFIFMVS